MQKTSEIYFLKNEEINKQQWDECINTSPNGLIYAQSFYLDNICTGWKALIGEHYEWVFPITSKTKFGISYLYQPPFTQQLGAFAKPGVTIPCEEIIYWLKTHFKFWEINWNYATTTSFINPPVQIAAANNFILDLSASYESIAAKFHKDLCKNIKRSKRFKLNYRCICDYKKCIQLFSNYYGNRLSLKDRDYKAFERVCDHALKYNMLTAREVVNNKDELMSIILLLNDGNRMYNILNTTTEAGRKTQANHFLLDSVIKEFSGKDLLLDFEGSDVQGVQLFYKNFGTINQPYFRLKYNALPWPINFIKN